MHGAKRRAILVVEDDEDILNAVALFLTDEGYPVVSAVNGRDALQLVDRHPLCLTLLDMRMPVMDGWSFAAAYRQRPGPHAPIIVMTASRDSKARAAEIAADAYIAKPFDLEELLDLVRRYALPDGEPAGCQRR